MVSFNDSDFLSISLEDEEEDDSLPFLGVLARTNFVAMESSCTFFAMGELFPPVVARSVGDGRGVIIWVVVAVYM